MPALAHSRRLSTIESCYAAQQQQSNSVGIADRGAKQPKVELQAEGLLDICRVRVPIRRSQILDPVGPLPHPGVLLQPLACPLPHILVLLLHGTLCRRRLVMCHSVSLVVRGLSSASAMPVRGLGSRKRFGSLKLQLISLSLLQSARSLPRLTLAMTFLDTGLLETASRCIVSAGLPFSVLFATRHFGLTAFSIPCASLTSP